MLIGVVTIAVNCDANERMAPRLALPVEGSATGSSTSGLAVARAGVAKFKVDWPVIEKGTFMARLGAPPLLATPQLMMRCPLQKMKMMSCALQMMMS